MKTIFNTDGHDEKTVYGVAISEAFGYRVQSHGHENFFALLPGEAEFKQDDDGDNFVGFFNSLKDLSEEMIETLEPETIFKTGMPESSWNALDYEERLKIAGSIPSIQARKESELLSASFSPDETISDAARAVSDKKHVILFHGTGSNMTSFISDAQFGGDRNSALGTHFSHSPRVAAEYAEMSADAENEPCVLVSIVPATNIFHMTDGCDFFGIDERGDYEREHSHFQEMRKRLVSEGFDMVEFEDGEQVIAVSLVPEQARIIARLDISTAYDLDESISEIYSESSKIKALEKTLSKRTEGFKKSPSP